MNVPYWLSHVCGRRARLALLAVLVCTGLLACSDDPPAEPEAASDVATDAATDLESSVEFDVATEDGRFFSAAHKDKIVYLDFWATWCAPCRASFPWMNEMRDKYEDQGLQIIAVSIDADRALARQFAEQLNAQFEVGYDPEGKVADLFQINAMPTSVIIGKNGKLIEVHKGFTDAKKPDYEASIVAALETIK